MFFRTFSDLLQVSYWHLKKLPALVMLILPVFRASETLCSNDLYLLSIEEPGTSATGGKLFEE